MAQLPHGCTIVQTAEDIKPGDRVMLGLLAGSFECVVGPKKQLVVAEDKPGLCKKDSVIPARDVFPLGLSSMIKIPKTNG